MTIAPREPRGATSSCLRLGSVAATRLGRRRLRPLRSRRLARERRVATRELGVVRAEVRLDRLRVDARELVLVVREPRRRSADAERLRLGEGLGDELLALVPLRALLDHVGVD